KFLLHFSIVYVCISATMYFTLSIAVVIFEELNKNRTEPRQTLYPVEYHIDSEKYFYLITAHCYASTVLLLLQTVVHDTMYIVLVQHGCALFAVTGQVYCLKGAHCLDSKGLLKDDDFEQYKNRCYTLSEQKKIYQRLVLGIKEHKRAIEYTKLLHAVFSECLFIVLMLNIISLSINGVQALINLHEIQTSIRLILWEIGLFIHLFWLCLPGQRLTDFSERVYYDVLNCLWYTFYSISHVLYRFLIMNTLKPCELIALKIIPLNMETFLSVYIIMNHRISLLTH
ncbi:hypothetical protein WH47_03955, partial [Habropoda laboriosa]